MKKFIYTVLLTALFTACGSEKKAKFVSIEPSETILKKMPNTNFSIVLDDMKIEEEADLTVYKHKYNVLKMVGDSLHQEKKSWQDVNKSFFLKHKNDLGMEILSKHNGKVSRVAQPVGFGWAIGNEKHGEWETIPADSTKTTNSNRHHRRWRTNSLSPFLWYWLGTRRNVYRNDYNQYQQDNRNGKAFYGSSSNTGGYKYGTRSNHEQKVRSSFFDRKKANSSKWNSLSRSSSRYSNGSSTRSRSGGFGK